MTFCMTDWPPHSQYGSLTLPLYISRCNRCSYILIIFVNPPSVSVFLCDSRQVSQHTTKRWQEKKQLEHSSTLPSTLLSSSNPAHLLKLNRSHRACLSAWRTLSGLSGAFQLQLQHNNHRRGEYSYSLRRRKERGGNSSKEKGHETVEESSI